MVEDSDYNRPPGFDLDGPFSQGEDTPLTDLAAIYGWEDWRDIIAPTGGFDETDLRPGVYFSPEDAMQQAHELGIADYASVWYDELDDTWHLVIDY